MVTDGADILSIDSKLAGVPMAEAKEKIGHLRCLYGNVDVAHTMLHGPVKEVEEETCEVIEEGSKGWGYIIGTACTIPRDTPVENFEAFIRTAKTFW